MTLLFPEMSRSTSALHMMRLRQIEIYFRGLYRSAFPLNRSKYEMLPPLERYQMPYEDYAKDAFSIENLESSHDLAIQIFDAVNQRLQEVKDGFVIEYKATMSPKTSPEFHSNCIITVRRSGVDIHTFTCSYTAVLNGDANQKRPH